MSDMVLGKHVAALPDWRWMAGMLCSVNGRLVWDKGPGYDGCWYMFPKAGTRVVQPELPDLSDHATLGCLLHLVRKKWADDEASPAWKRDLWMLDIAGWVFWGGTEAEVLVKALEASP